MKCKQVRLALEDALDRKTEPDPEVLDHLQACTACPAEHARLQRLSELLAARQVVPEGAQAAVRRAVAGALGRAPVAAPVMLRRATMALLPHFAWACAVIAAFAVGWHARPVRTVERTVQVPVVKERVVVREVSVVRERLVRKIVRVPVVLTRVVTRYLPQPSGATPSPQAVALSLWAVPPQPPIVLEYLPSPEATPQVEYSESVRLAALASDEPKR